MTRLSRIESPAFTCFHVSNGWIRLSGWCLDRKRALSPERVFVRLGRRVIECDQVERPDLLTGKESKLPPLTSGRAPLAGYQAEFKIGPGLKWIRIYAVFQGRARRIGSVLAFCKPGPAATGAPTPDYAEWIRRYDTTTEADLAAMRRTLAKWGSGPRFSIVMPVYNPPIEFLREAIESVRQQVYENWEFCIADDCSSQPEVRRVLEEYAADDPRIRVVFRSTNGHISAASNSALALATGGWVALLDHDDRLAPDALYQLAERIRCQPDLQMIYSDEDKIDASGEVRFEPYFRTD